ncbi:hypothetical protein CAPTEDRAFT_159016 [Capitella teleta]|uniref:Cyclin-D1-binding protein 1 homolog n=1 Tax=Capitella teleta TaxID=283909 RepID=R7TE53_CAPTE|nr:hypothetical protein CAPTEDRAFT_159016 [Capitella teleta]|eukprot:ELT91782.1 hypothetical protein CAPTEDRAFT_159016 [Capitella teleta]
MSSADEKQFFQDYKDNLRLAIEQLNDETIQRSVSEGKFDGAMFWNRINSTVQVISSACTKLSLAYNEPPVPTTKEGQPLFEGVLNGVLAMLSAFYALPISQGVYLQKRTREAVIEIIKAALDLIEIISSDDPGAKEQLHSTGNVWEKCDAFDDLPRDTRQWLLSAVERVSSLVKDALHELDQAILNETSDMFDGFGEVSLLSDDGVAMPIMPAWTEQDKAILAPCQGLVKVCKACLKRVGNAVQMRGKCSDGESIAQLDDLGQICSGLSALVDDLVAGLYPPVSHAGVKSQADRLSLHLHKLLDYTRHSHVITEADASWLDFLVNAIDHNVKKVHELTN